MNTPGIRRIAKFSLIAFGAIALIGMCLPVFVCDQFRIAGNSMFPTLKEGDHVLVDKLLMGARIYTRYDFADPVLSCVRLPGITHLKPGDVAVFNYPHGRDRDKIEFRINYVYVKRCIGCPGDTVKIINGFYENNRLPGNSLCPSELQEILSRSSDTELNARGVCMETIPISGDSCWTIRNFGPMFIPSKGSRVKMDTFTAALYSLEIEYETGKCPEIAGENVYLDGKQVFEYEFKTDWYFFGGDNVFNSRDSRYIGLVPEDYIIGKATRILFSEGSGSHSFKRFMKKI